MLMTGTEKGLRRLFGQRIGEIAQAAGLLDTAALERALTVQTRCLALSLAGEEISEGASWRDSPLFAEVKDRWAKTAAAHGISEDHLRQAGERIGQASEGLPARQAPAMGEVIAALEPAARDAIHTLLTAQAAQRLLEVAENAVTQAIAEEGPGLDAIRAWPLWERNATPGDPDWLTGVQGTLFAARMLEAAVQTHSPLAEVEAVNRAWAAFLVLALGALQKAGEKLPAIAARTSALLKEKSARWKVESPVSPALMHAALQAASEGMDAADISLGQRHAEEQMERRRRERGEKNEEEGEF